MTGKIFISYRRSESTKDARALYERLRREFGEQRVFVDLEGIEPGEDFVDLLERHLKGCEVLIALIGRDWADAKNEYGERRLDDENDFVRIELRAALRRGIKVFPVLIDGASPPRASQLPEDMRPLVRRQAIALDYSKFDADAMRLVLAIRKAIERPADAREAGPIAVEPAGSDAPGSHGAATAGLSAPGPGTARPDLTKSSEAAPFGDGSAGPSDLPNLAASESPVEPTLDTGDRNDRGDSGARGDRDLRQSAIPASPKLSPAPVRVLEPVVLRAPAPELVSAPGAVIASGDVRASTSAAAARQAVERIADAAGNEAHRPSSDTPVPDQPGGATGPRYRCVWLSILFFCLLSIPVVGAWMLFSRAPSSEMPRLLAGDTVWMTVATALAAMLVPGLVLFWSGLLRTKSMHSLLARTLLTCAMALVLWFSFGYSIAFTEGNAYVGGLDRLFLKGAFDSLAATFSKGIYIPELLFLTHQGAVAGLACCMVVAPLVDRLRFSALLIFVTLWFSFALLPLMHMTWFWIGPDAYSSKEVVDAMNAKAGLLWKWGALDHAGGLPVHINVAVAGLICIVLGGTRVGAVEQASEPMSPMRALTGIFLVGLAWLGLTAGSALEAGPLAWRSAAATILAAPAAALAWGLGEMGSKGRSSRQGPTLGALAGLVAITPAAGNVGMAGALAIGAISGFACFWGVNGLKALFVADDALGFFGILGIGGVIGTVLTGVFNNSALGGPGLVTDFVVMTIDSNSIASQVLIQLKAVLLAIVWSAVVSLAAFQLVAWSLGWSIAAVSYRQDGHAG